MAWIGVATGGTLTARPSCRLTPRREVLVFDIISTHPLFFFTLLVAVTNFAFGMAWGVHLARPRGPYA